LQNIDRKKLIQRYYSARAKDYDRQKSRTWESSRGFGDEVVDEMLHALRSFRKRLLLEVGIGTGRNALPLLEKVDSSIVGLDLSREMLELARNKISSFKRNLNLIRGDLEHLPFVDRSFDVIICMSTMHYFEHQAQTLEKFSRALKERGTLLYGDITLHESDDQRFCDMLERTLSKGHASYYKPSEIRRLIESRGFGVKRMRTIAYRKSYRSLIEDKGEYFDVTLGMLNKCIRMAGADAKQQYGLRDTGLTLFYTVVTAEKEH